MILLHVLALPFFGYARRAESNTQMLFTYIYIYMYFVYTYIYIYIYVYVSICYINSDLTPRKIPRRAKSNTQNGRNISL